MEEFQYKVKCKILQNVFSLLRFRVL